MLTAYWLKTRLSDPPWFSPLNTTVQEQVSIPMTEPASEVVKKSQPRSCQVSLDGAKAPGVKR